MATFATLFSQEQIRQRLAQLADEINQHFGMEPVTVVGVLKGAFVFTADLIRLLKMPVTVDFIGVSSYAGTESTGHVRITSDLTSDIKGKSIILVEDIIDTGRTIDYLSTLLQARAPKQFKICTLLSKPEAQQGMVHPIAYTGFVIKNEFVVGYGLDVNESYRQLPYLAKLNDY